MTCAQRIKSTEPELDIELSQILQDNINDLSNAPEPIQIKLYSEDPVLLNKLGPEVGDAIGKIDGVTDVENGIDNTISGPATNFQVDPVVAARLGFTPQEVSEDATAILDGIETNNPHDCQRPRVPHPRAPWRRASRIARRDSHHRLQ